MIISTGDLKENYSIIDTIFAIDSHKDGFFSGADPNKAFEGLKSQLAKKCQSLGGDAVINCQFEYRDALADGLTKKKHAIEIFGYGTAVKLN